MTANLASGVWMIGSDGSNLVAIHEMLMKEHQALHAYVAYLSVVAPIVIDLGTLYRLDSVLC